VVVALNDEELLKPLGYGAALAEAHAAAESAGYALDRELADDSGAMKEVRKARAAFDRAAKAHALQVQSLLVRAERESELGRFVLAKDAAYAARRAAGAPLSEEPGVAEVDAEAPAALLGNTDRPRS